MAIKRTLKRGIVKAERKILGKPKEVMITTGKGGLTKSEIKDVLATLSSAGKRGELPQMSYEYRPPFLLGREPIFLIPKDGKVHKARVLIREVMKARYGTQFIVDGSKTSSTPSISERRSISKRKPPRITPKTPKLR